MGQITSNPAPFEALFDFVNLPKEAIMSLWLSYNLYGEGWSLDFDQFHSIFTEAAYLRDNYGYSQEQLRAVFNIFDTDNNGLIDALEMLTTIGILSGMDAIEKVYFAFNAFDFDSRGSLSNDEANLLFRSIIKGLKKITSTNETLNAVTAQDAEKFADLVFAAMNKSKESGRISSDEFKTYSVSHPIVSNWLKSVASLDVPGNNNDKGVVEEKERDGWVATLNGRFDAAKVRARLHALQLEDIDIVFQEEQKVVDDDISEATTIDVTPAWIGKVNRLKPEEVPAQIRSDLPEDVFEPLWVGGINTRRISSTFSSFAQSQIHRCARYRAVGSNSILYSAGTSIISIKKNEETQLWNQEIFNEHSHPISCFDMNYAKNILVSADRPINAISHNKAPCRLIIWDTNSFKVKNRIEVPSGVKFIDVNSLGTMAVTLSDDTGNTLTILDLHTGKAIYSKKVTFDTLGDYVNDVRFFGSTNIIAIACEKQGIRFFINEESGVMGKNNMQMYEERTALYGAVGKAAKGSAATVLARLEFPDELVCGTDSGHILVWRGRTVSQLIEAHRGKVTSLDYDPTSKTLVSAGEDGTVKLYEIRDPAASSASGLVPKGPRPPSVRSIVESASFDILRHNLSGYKISSVAISEGANKAIVVTASNELVEVTCKVAPPPAEEVQEAAEGGEEGVPVSTGKIGDDLHGGVLVSGHFVADDTSNSQAISSVTKVGNGFATCGSDGTVRLWNPVGEGETGITYKLVKTIKMDCACSAVTSSAASLAVALSGDNSSRTGSIHLFALPDGTFITELTDCKSTIVDVKMSPEGNLVVASSVDGSIYVFTQAEGVWSLKGKLSVGGEVAESMDLSADNQYLRVYYSSSKDLKVFELAANFGNEIYATLPPPAEPKPVVEGEEGEPAPVPGAAIIETLKGIQWASNNCPYNWDNVGVSSLIVPRTKIPNIYDRSNHLLLCSVDDGTVDVSRVPALNVTNQKRRVTSHNGPLAGLTFFDEGGVKLLTAGGVDGNLRVYKVNYDMDEFEFDIPDPPAEEGEAKEEAGGEEEEGGMKALPILYDSGDEDDLEDGKKLKLHLKRDLSGDSFAEKLVNNWTAALECADKEDLSRFAAKSLNSSSTLLPNDELEVEWIYGCSSRQTRGSVRYTTDGHIVYPAGSIPVVFDKVNRKQTHVFPHKDEITCLDVHVSKNLAATSHKGAGNIYIYIWKTNDGKVLKVIECGRVGGISAIKFSPDASLLIVSCQDTDHSVLVYNVEDGCLLAKTRGGSQKVLCLAFSDVPMGPTYRILQGGVKHYKLLSYQSNLQTIQSKTGAYGADVRKSHVNCVSSLPMALGEGDSVSGNEFILGMSDGTVGFVARGESKVSGFNPIMKGAVTAISVARIKAATAEEPPVYKVIVGGVNGFIKVLDQELQPLSEFNLYVKDYGLYPLGRVRGFKSLCVDKLNRKILYGTAAGEIGEIDLATGEDLNQNQPIIHSHFRAQLNALAAHPLRAECLTAGEDKTLRVWNLETHSQTAILELPGPAVAGAFAPNGHLIVVSLSRKNTDPFGGRLAIVSFLQGKIRIVHTTNDAREEILSVVFSPDGSKVYAASMDCTVYVYDALNNFQLVNTLNGHQEGVKSLDISEDGKYLISESVQNNVIVWDIRTSSQITKPSEIFETLGEVDRNYHTRQNLFGLNSVGAFPSSSKCEVLCLAQSRDKKLLATGDQNGQLKLFSNPATSVNAPHRNYNIHTPGGLSKTAFTAGDLHVLTVGKYDKVLVQWKLTRNEDAPDTAPSSSSASRAQGADDPFDASFSVKGVDFRNDSATTVAHKHIVSQLSNIVGAGNHNAPLVNLPSAIFCGHGEVMTVVGKTVAVCEGDSNRKIRVWNTNTINPLSSNKQSISKLDVGTVAVSPSGRFAIVGYIPSADNSKAPVHLYHAPTGDFLMELVAEAEGGISTAAFSKDSNLAALLGRDAQHTMYVFKSFSGHWNDATLIHQTHVSAANVNKLAFLVSPDSPLSSSANEIVTAGEGQIKFWHVNSLNLRCETGHYGETKFAPITAVVGGMGNGARDEAITGDSEGNVYLWRGKFRNLLIETHPSAVTAMTSFGSVDGLKAGFIVASKEKISIWSTNTNIYLLHQITMNSLLSKVGWSSSLYTRDAELSSTVVRNLTSDPECRQVIVSLNNGMVVSLSTDSGDVRKIFESHGNNTTVRQMITHPSIDSLALTVSEDSALRLWDLSGDAVYSGVSLKKHPPTKSNSANLVGSLVLPHAPTAVEFFNDNTLLVAISNTDQDGVSGAVLVVDMQKNDVKGEAPYRFTIINRMHNIGQGSIRHLRISPQQKYLASGSDDGCVYIHQIGQGSLDSDDKFTPVGFFLAHTFGAPVVGVDFSLDNRYVRSFGPNNAYLNGKVEVNFFDFDLPGGEAPMSTNPLKKYAGGKIQDVGVIESLKSTKWGSVSSPAAPEVRGISFTAEDDVNQVLHVENLSVSHDGQLLAAGYRDGLIRVFRNPVPSRFAASVANASLVLSYHAVGGVHVAFQKSSSSDLYQLVSYGNTDQSFLVHTLEV